MFLMVSALYLRHPANIYCLYYFHSSAAKSCSDYRDFTPDHSMCKPLNKGCDIKDRQLTEAEKKKILKLHNEYRSKVSSILI